MTWHDLRPSSGAQIPAYLWASRDGGYYLLERCGGRTRLLLLLLQRLLVGVRAASSALGAGAR